MEIRKKLCHTESLADVSFTFRYDAPRREAATLNDALHTEHGLQVFIIETSSLRAR